MVKIKNKQILIGVLFIIVAITGLIFMPFAIAQIGERMGDVNLNTPGRTSEAVFNYETAYYWDNDNIQLLTKLCNSLFLASDYKKQLIYYPKLIDSNKNEKGEKHYTIYLIGYIRALYQTGNIEEYKKQYEVLLDRYEKDIAAGAINPTNKTAHDAGEQMQNALTVLMIDQNAQKEDMVWAIGAFDKLLQHISLEHYGSAIYLSESILYQRLGNVQKAFEMKNKSEELAREYGSDPYMENNIVDA